MMINTSGMRHRTNALTTHFVSTTEMFRDVSCDAPPPTDPAIKQSVSSSTSDQMWDVVIKDFHQRSKDGEIFNNPMYKEHIVFTATPVNANGVITYYQKSGDKFVCMHEKHARKTNACHPGNIGKIIDVPYERLKNLAITAAYAGVSSTEQNAALWIGEFKETVKMFLGIGKLILSLYQKTKKQRLKWAKGKLNVTEAQSLTLTILYGLLPLEQSITQFMEGIFKLKPDGARETSRGFQVYTDMKTVNDSNIIGGWGEAEVSHFRTDLVQVSVRAGVLYDIDVTDIPAFIPHVSPNNLVETAYALARLSFVIDWFINVGNTLAAWSPSVGTKILSAWVSVEEKYESDGFNQFRINPGSYNSGNNKVGGSYNEKLPYTYKSTIKYRVPIDRSDLAILPRIDINLDIDKILAMVLLFTKVKKP